MAKKLKFDWDSIDQKMDEYEKKTEKKKFERDERFYVPKKKEDGSFTSVIRFLPPPKGEDLPKVKYWDHFFQDKGGWLIENCLNTLKQSCPICEANSEAWNSGQKGLAGRRRKNLHYVCNIVVLKDEQCPENVGKVFLYSFGVKVNEFILEARNPTDEDEIKCNIFDPYDGANFKLKIYTKEIKNEKTGATESMPQYDKCKFLAPSELFDGDNEKIAEAYEQAYSLKDFINPDNFKTYDDLAARLEKVSKQSFNKPAPKEEKDIDLNIVDDNDDFINKIQGGDEKKDEKVDKKKDDKADKEPEDSSDGFNFADD